MNRLRLPTIVLATTLAAAATAAPAHAAEVVIGSDLSQPATVALSDGNDTFYWQGSKPAGITVPVQGEVRAIKIKGGTVQTPEQTTHAKATDPDYDIFQWVVLRPQGDGTYRTVVTSERNVAPVIGRGGVDENTITTLRQPQDNARICTKPGDVVAAATVGGYVASDRGTQNGFDKGLPYQMFARSGTSSLFEFRAGGAVQEGVTPVIGSEMNGVELLMQAVIGTGPDARFSCQTPEEQKGAAGPGGGGGGGGGGGAAQPLPPMATPLLKARRLTKKGTVPVNLTCRAEGTDCAGTIELRAHKKTIGKRKYVLAKGASGVFAVKLTKRGKRFVKVASKKKLRTAVVVTATGGRKASGIFNIRPVKR